MIIHILKDGTILKDISGHTVKREDAPVAYEVLERKAKGEQIHGKYSRVNRQSRGNRAGIARI